LANASDASRFLIVTYIAARTAKDEMLLYEVGAAKSCFFSRRGPNMQAFANVATQPERKVSKTTQRGYYEFRACESQRGEDKFPTWYTIRIMKDEDPKLSKGDFVKVTGKLLTF
jgi:hypothetical protein